MDLRFGDVHLDPASDPPEGDRAVLDAFCAVWEQLQFENDVGFRPLKKEKGGKPSITIAQQHLGIGVDRRAPNATSSFLSDLHQREGGAEVA